MGRLNLVISDDLEKQFRDAVYRRLGMKKGNIQQATEEAIREWVAKK